MDKIVVYVNSPTPTLVNKIVNTIVGEQPQLSSISKIVFYDGTERDYTTSIEYSIVDNSLRLNCYVTATGNYTIQSIRIYDTADSLIFEKNVTRSVEANKTYNVVIYIMLYFNPDPNMNFVMEQFRNTLYNVLSGQTQPAKLRPAKVGFIVFIYDENYSATYYVNTSNLKQSNTQALVRAEITLPAGVCVEGFIIANEDTEPLYRYYNKECIDITRRTQVTYSETIQLG